VFSLPPADRILAVLKILDRLAADTHADPLASSAVSQQDVGEGRERIDRLLTYVHQHYAEGVTLQQLADVAALSVSGLHRLFRKHTKTTVSDYLIRLRIGDACGRLSGTEQPISFVADAVGYASIANFNRQFKALKSITPREYRRLFRVTPSVR
jgi:transcriptional regulator GlxA family with amidase domain